MGLPLPKTDLRQTKKRGQAFARPRHIIRLIRLSEAAKAAVAAVAADDHQSATPPSTPSTPSPRWVAIAITVAVAITGTIPAAAAVVGCRRAVTVAGGRLAMDHLGLHWPVIFIGVHVTEGLGRARGIHSHRGVDPEAEQGFGIDHGRVAAGQQYAGDADDGSGTRADGRATAPIGGSANGGAHRGGGGDGSHIVAGGS